MDWTPRLAVVYGRWGDWTVMELLNDCYKTLPIPYMIRFRALPFRTVCSADLQHEMGLELLAFGIGKTDIGQHLAAAFFERHATSFFNRHR